MKKKLNPMSTAPSDKLILLDVGLPNLVIGIFNRVENEFVYANLQAGLYGALEDYYFENEYCKEPKGWLEFG